MAIKVKDHGFWTIYVPEQYPPGYPEGAIFARREDGADWYRYVYEDKPFKADSVIATAMPEGDKLRIQAIYRDASKLFPAGMRVIEISGVDPADPKPHKLFEQKFVDLKTGKFTAPKSV